MPAAQPAFDPADAVLLRRLRTLAEEAAQSGGRVARAAFSGNFTIRRKADGTEVTSADEAAQAAIVALLHAQRPADAFVTEEDAARSGPLPAAPANDTLCWVIDPIDGTRNFVHGVPLYAVSVAAMFAGVPVVGAIYLPERDELYSANGPEGLLINRRPPPGARPPLPLRSGGRPPKPLVGVPSSFQGGAYAVIQRWMSWGEPGVQSPQVVSRNTGATAMHLAMVAAGQLQAALISDSRLWDIAAGWLLVKVIGGVMTTLDGRDIFPLDLARYAGEAIPSLASANSALHKSLLGL